MKKLTVSSLKMLLRDRQALFWAIAFPAIFAIVFGLFDFDQPPEIEVAVVAERATPVSQPLVAALRDVETFTVTTPKRIGAARSDLAAGELDVVIEMAAEGNAVRVFYDETNFQTNQLALSTIRQVVDSMNLSMAGVSTPPITIEQTPVAAKSASYYDFLLPGLVAMGVMNFAITGVAIAISQFRQQRILKRILATPLAPVRFLAAQVASRLVLSLVQVGVILAVGVFLFGAQIYGNVLWLFLLAAVANLIFLNLGFMIAGRAPNPDAAQGMAQAIALPMMFMSGVFFSTDMLPKILQSIVTYLPLTPLIEALRTVSVDGESITATGSQLVLLAAWIVVSFVLASRSFRFAKA